MALGWEDEPKVDGRLVVSNVITHVLSQRSQKVLFFTAASNYGSATGDLFPAHQPNVTAIRATTAFGLHTSSNSSLPQGSETTFGTLGEAVPARSKGRTSSEIGMSGASPATVIAAGLAAVVIGYVMVHDHDCSWDSIRTQVCFRRFLLNNVESAAKQTRFFTLEKFYSEGDRRKFETALYGAV